MADKVIKDRVILGGFIRAEDAELEAKKIAAPVARVVLVFDRAALIGTFVVATGYPCPCCNNRSVDLEAEGG